MSRESGMTVEEAKRLLKSSRETRWSFPSSQGTPIRKDSEMSRWTDRFVPRRESFKEAIDVLIRNGYEDEAVEVAANIWRLWIIARDNDGGRKLLDGTLEATKKVSRHRALALYGNGLFAFKQGKLQESQKYSQEALEIAEKFRDREAIVLANLGLGRVAFEEGNYRLALSLSTKAVDLTRGLDLSLGQAPLFMKAQSTRMLGNYNAAADLFRKSVELNRTIDDKGMVVAELTNLGFVEVHQGNFDLAEKHFSESETLASGEDPYGAAMVQLQKAVIAFVRKDRDLARQLLEKSKELLGKVGFDPGPDDKFEIEWLERQLQR